MGFKFLTCCDRDFLAGGILRVALNLILRCKLSQNLPTNDSLKKDPVKLQVPENCILPGFFKILPPRRHSLGQRDRKGCGILSFSPSLYIMLSLSPLCLKPLTLLGCPHNAALSIDLSGTWYFLSTAENVQPQTRQTFHLGILQNCDPKLMICSVRFVVENQHVWVDVRYYSMSLAWTVIECHW